MKLICIDEATLNTILTLEDEVYLRRASLIALKRVGALRQGLHCASLTNGSTEFSEHRSYSAGDSVRELDWRILAKTHRPYIKRFHDPSSLQATIVFDASGSMLFESVHGRKIDYARRIAMFVTRLLLDQGDPVGLMVASRHRESRIAPRSTRAQGSLIENTLLKTKPDGETILTDLLNKMSSHLRNPSHLIIVTDGFFTLSPFEAALRRLSAQRHQIMFLQVLSPEEVDLQLKGAIRFRCMESGSTITASADDIRRQYQSQFNNHQLALSTAVNRLGGTIDIMNMDEPAGRAVTQALLRRSAMANSSKRSNQ